MVKRCDVFGDSMMVMYVEICSGSCECEDGSVNCCGTILQ